MLAAATLLSTQSDVVKITNQPICEGRINRMQCGQFMEYLCNLFPGMWAEKLTDGGFEGLTPYKFEFVRQKDDREQPWYPSGAVNRGHYTLDREKPINGETCQKIEVPGGTKCTLGISQDGIFVDPSDSCRFSIWLKQEGVANGVNVRLHDGGTDLSACHFSPTEKWQKFDAVLAVSSRTTHATISIEFQGPGTVWMDAASLMPEKNVGGWRPDVVSAMTRLNPGVIRIGGSVMDDPNLGDFQWTDTIGDPDFRKPFRAWGGLQPTGPGIEEFVQFCHLVNAEPLICVRVRERTPKDAFDEVQYFNGATTTPMGALRAKNGHPDPYNVHFWQVGNERSGAEYERILPEFCRAMKEADPGIKLFSSFPTEGVLKVAGEYLDYVCPHHYECENLTAENDDFSSIREMLVRLAPGKNIKIAVTEWNTTAGDMGLGRAKLWTLENALACSRYQNLMHRNSDLVEIANRSNLTNSFNSGILQSDNSRLYMTPTYYSQLLYSKLAEPKPLRIDPPAPLKEGLDISATASESGDTMVLFAVNESTDSVAKTLDLSAFGAIAQKVEVWTLEDREHAGEPDVTNSFDVPLRVTPKEKDARAQGQSLSYTFSPLSLTVLRFHRE